LGFLFQNQAWLEQPGSGDDLVKICSESWTKLAAKQVGSEDSDGESVDEDGNDDDDDDSVEGDKEEERPCNSRMPKRQRIHPREPTAGAQFSFNFSL